MPWYKVSAEWEEQHYPVPTIEEEEEMAYFPRRNTQDRMAEAAVYKARTEAATIPTVSLKYCEYDKTRKVLKLASEYFGMPPTFFVKSHHTGKEVRFVAVGEHDILFDQDGWDGEQQIYRPTSDVPGVDHMVIYHAW
jgi:hypothetical protein